MKGQPHLFLGVDGGQSSTLAVICAGDGRLLGSGRAGPSNHIHEPGGLERLRGALQGSILGAWQSAGFPLQDRPHFIAGCLGMTGRGEQVEEVAREIAHFERLSVRHDSATAHAGALAGKPGVMVIAGTGSVALAVDSTGKTARAGGWSHLMGDEGSGYDIGRQALVAAARVEDGRGPKTSLHATVLAHFGKQSLWDVHSLVHAEGFARAEIAALARLVSQAAQAGDEVAQAILDQAGRSLAEIALASLRTLKMERSEVLVSPVGGVFQAGERILGPFLHHLQAGAPQAVLVPPAYPPALGAVILAYQAAGITLNTQILNNLTQAARQLGTK